MSTQFRSDDTVKWWLRFGNGSDGDYSSTGNATDAPVDSSCSGNANSTSLSATNASFAADKPVLIHQTRGTGAGNWELNQIQSYTSGTITLKKALQNTYTDSGASQAQVIQLKQYNNFTQNSGHTLTAKAWDGNVGGILAFLCNGTTTITGNISANNTGFIGGAFSNYGSAGGNNTATAFRGEGTSGDNNTRQATANGNGGGGGPTGGDNGTGGGGGGNGQAGTRVNNSDGRGGDGGNTAGNAELTQLSLGGGGGGGREKTNGGDSGSSSSGARGAGAVFIFSNELVITGTITSTGLSASNATGNNNGGGGGGAGGSVLLKAKTATLGTNKITANGGTGGAGVPNGGSGGNGGVGRIHLDYSGSYTGTTSPTLDSTLDPTIKGVSPNNMFLAF